ncbi:MAG: methyltransferase domain-containing protein [Clostridia bacterium]|nr:methyltransferase domain-containing protein [Clostridia bacterium]
MLPQKFTERMKSLLGEEYQEFLKAMEEPAVRGLRVNLIKSTPDALLSRNTLTLSKIPYCDNAFFEDGEEKIGVTPEHHSGEIYVQDPGAIAPLSALEIKPGWRVLDLCAAPGGKSSQAAERIGDGGFLLSNEYVPKRAKILVSNFERLGTKNAMVTSLDTKEFKKYFDSHFDLVILDAPCSGEGMFRKNPEAISEWSEENVLLSAKRQKEILENAAPLVKTGGYLLYSTCTFSLEENEMQIDAFLKSHPDFTLKPCRDELVFATSDGISFDGAYTDTLHLARRFYPHKSRGEGQFTALMQKTGEDNEKKQTILYKDASREPSREESLAVSAFFRENLEKEPLGCVRKYGENLVLISHGHPLLPKSVFSAGVLIGEVKKNVLHPAHQFFSCYGSLFKRKLSLKTGDARLTKYLFGEEIDAPEISGKGYVAVLYENVTLGGGKLSDGKLKNHYPKGLRLTK